MNNFFEDKYGRNTCVLNTGVCKYSAQSGANRSPGNLSPRVSSRSSSPHAFFSKMAKVYVHVLGDKGGPYSLEIPNIQDATVRDLKQIAEAEDRLVNFTEIRLDEVPLLWMDSLQSFESVNALSNPYILIPAVSPIKGFHAVAFQKTVHFLEAMVSFMLAKVPPKPSAELTPEVKRLAVEVMDK